MGFWTAIVIIVALGVLPQLIEAFKSSGSNKRAKAQDARLAELEAVNQQLHERVEVLERIVTDGNYDLQQQFSKLG